MKFVLEMFSDSLLQRNQCETFEISIFNTLISFKIFIGIKNVCIVRKEYKTEEGRWIYYVINVNEKNPITNPIADSI